MQSRLYEGQITHRRMQPVAHAFRYGLFMLYIDLDELPDLFRPYFLWSASGPAIARFHRQDHYGPVDRPLKETICELVEKRTSVSPKGPIRLLTHLRYFGYCMNPVSFYFCRHEDDTRTEFIVAEVHNTPWGETHCYVMDCRALKDTYRFEFDKAFHVSPFMPMQQQYEWTLSEPEDTLAVHMVSFQKHSLVFSAHLSLQQKPINQLNLTLALLRYPFMTLRVVSAIYWQALKLWLKKAPFFEHPRRYQKDGFKL